MHQSQHEYPISIFVFPESDMVCL